MVNFVKEALLMKDFKHMNVLPLVGIVYEHAEVDALPLVVTPFMEKGDLKTLISDCSYVSCMFAAKHVQMYACCFFSLMITNEETLQILQRILPALCS